MEAAMPKLSLMIVIVTATGIAETGGGDWKEFRSKEHGFCVLYPSQPKLNVTKSGGMEMKVFDVELNKCVFRIAVVDYPGAQFEKEALAEERLELLTKSATAKLKLEKATKITLAGALLGREIWASSDSGDMVHARVFLVNGRVYQVLVSGPRERATSAEAEKFLDSFVLSQ
ncbi:MAG TPA: hypothetical protein VE988_21100 [Gemmataceae bacterium]|nr:hypothetical protein [Gemmataceae bacterium]